MLLGGIAAATVGPWLVLVLLSCGAASLALAWRAGAVASSGPPLLLATAGTGGIGALCWTALKVGALSYGGGFVIIPLMQADAVGTHHWMTDAQFLNAVALGQVTPGPVVHTVAVVGYAVAGVGGGLLAALVAFAPSFVFVLGGADRSTRCCATRAPARSSTAPARRARRDPRLGDPAGRRAAEGWQWAVLAGAALALLALR